MNDLERDLIRALHHQPAGHTDGRLLEVVQARIGRWRRIRAAGAAITAAGTLTVAAALLVGGGRGSTAAMMSPEGSPEHPVPWTGRPAPAYTPPVARTPAAPAAQYAPCTAADLAGRPGAFSLGTGHYTRYLVLTNVSTHPCTLSRGPSTITGVRADGSQTTLGGAARQSPDINLIGPANLQPRQAAQVSLTTTYGCAGRPTCHSTRYTAVAIGIGGSGRVRVTFPTSQPFNMVNGITVSTFGVPAPPPAQNSSPLNILAATTTMPRTLTAGTTASYTVTLHNPTSHPVTLRPCPSYAEFIFPLATEPASPVHRYYVNCQALSKIPASRSVTFRMRIQAPATPGPAKYGWTLQGTSVQTGGAVTVIPHS